jgi:hypothetical protein
MHHSIDRAVIAATLTACTMLGTGMVWAAPARAADNPMQVCGAKYQAAKAARTLPADQSWRQFLAACRAALPKAPDAAPSPVKQAAGDRPAPARAAGELSSAQVAERSRIKQCAAQWQADKAANKTAPGQTWPHYWSACSARLKG